jgi:cobalamin biosynthesis Mg chelatase CobN
MVAMSLNRWLAVLIVVSAGLFAVGAAIERNKSGESGHKEAQTAQPSPSESGGGTHTESGGESSSTGSGGEAHPESRGKTSSEKASTGETHSESSEKIFGINPESTGLVIAAVVAAVLLAVAVWFSPLSLVLLAVITFGVVFAVFDVREVVHQANESRAGLVVIASILGLIHLGVAAIAAVLWRSPTARSRVAASG